MVLSRLHRHIIRFDSRVEQDPCKLELRNIAATPENVPRRSPKPASRWFSPSSHPFLLTLLNLSGCLKPNQTL